MPTQFTAFYTSLSPDPAQRGKQFEHFVKWFLKADPEWATQVDQVWLWNDWPQRWGTDCGIDLVFRHKNGEHWAVQAKCYSPDYDITKHDVDKFLSESNRPLIQHRLLIATTDRIGANAKQVCDAQDKPVIRFLLSDFEKSALDYPVDFAALPRANRLAYQTALAQERDTHHKAENDLDAARHAQTKLLQTLPHYRDQASAYADLAKQGYMSKLSATDKERERLEKEQDLETQEHLIESAKATLALSSRKLQQISADYRQKLQAERADVSDRLDKAQAELTKQQYRNALLELKAPDDGCGGVAAPKVGNPQPTEGWAELTPQQPGTPRPTPCEYIIKDLATHTIGTVISPGTILMSLVPKDETLRAEVWVSNADVGFIHTGQATKIKLASYQFQKYGMVDGSIAHLSADASDNMQQGAGSSASPTAKSPNGQAYAYRALVDLKAQELMVDGVKHALSPGMQVTAEIHLGTRTILEYLLSPVMGAFQEAGRER